MAQSSNAIRRLGFLKADHRVQDGKNAVTGNPSVFLPRCRE
jgi:hypothetical protein